MPKVTAIVSRVTNHVSLVQGHEYRVIGIDDECFRIIDESGEPALHPKAFFLDEQITLPTDWVFLNFGDGEYVYSPPEFAQVGFFEDYADRQPAAVQQLRRYVEMQKQLDLE